MLQNCWYGLPISKTRRNKPHPQDHEVTTSAGNLGATDAQTKGLKGQKDQTPKRTNAPRLLVQVSNFKERGVTNLQEREA